MASAPTYFSYIKNKEKKFEIKSNLNKIFYFTLLNKGETLLISSYYNFNNSKKEYETKFDLSYIKSVKLFIIYDTLDDCLDEIFSGIDTGKSYLVEEDKFINLYIPLNNKKFNEIMFKINSKENIDIFNDKKMIEFNSIINGQKKEISELKDKIENLEILIKELLTFKKEIEGKITFRINSYISDSYFYILLLKKWLNSINNNSTKIIKSKLLFRLSRDGDSVDTFHKLCDEISPTLILVEASNGRKFGGFTTCVWSVNKGGKKDGKTFLFSFDEKKMFKKREESKNERDIYCRKDAGPIFGGNDFYFYQNLKKGYSSSPYYFLEKNDLAKNTSDDFDIKEVEIYKIGFE